MAAPAKLAPARSSKVPNPLRITARRDEIALAIELQHVDGNRAPLSARPATYRQGGDHPDPHEQRIQDPAGKLVRLQIARCLIHFGSAAM